MKIIIMVLSLCLSVAVKAETVVINPDKDNTLYESATGNLSNGSGDYLFVGRTNQTVGLSIRRGLLHFDIAGNIPAGSVITDVQLTLNMNRSLGSTQTVTLHKLISDWGEGTSNASGQEGSGATAANGDATWTNTFFGSGSWNSNGGDYLTLQSADLPITGVGNYVFQSTEMADDVQDWLDNPANNFGWIMRGNEGSSGTAKRFASRENSSNQPALTVTYSPLETVQLNPVKDNTLYETVDGNSSNGSGNRLFFGLSGQTNPTRRAVLEFDVSSIHPESTITDVQLEVSVTNIPPGAFAGTVNAEIHMLTAEWGEGSSSGSGNGAPSTTGDATWLHRFYDTINWITAGGDYMATASATAPFDDSTTLIQFASTLDLVADVTTWIQGADNNHGWIIIGDEVNGSNVRGVSSREGTSPPVLTIQLLPPPDLIFAGGFE